MRFFAFLLAFLPLVAFGQTTPTFQVKTVANLTAQPIPVINNRLTALVVGGLTTNDGRGGLYFYDANSVLAADADWDVVASAGAGKWIRQNWELRGRMNSSNNVAMRWKNAAATYVDILNLDATDNVRIFTPAGKQTQVDVELVSPTIDATLGFQINNLAPVGEYPRGNGTRFVSSTIQAGDLPAAMFANPSTMIGLSPIGGMALTAMRSDAAPALDQSITPFWTSQHIFGGAMILTNVTDPKIRFQTVGTNLVLGMDTSANSDFVISLGTALGTTDIMRVQRDGDKMAWGLGAVAGAANTISIGENAISGAASAQTILIGSGATATGNDTTVVGYGAIGGLDVNVAMGSGADAGTSGRENVVLGDDSKVLSPTVTFATAGGRLSKVTNNAVAWGAGAKAHGTGSGAFGFQTETIHDSSWVFARQGLSTLTSQLVFGSSGTPVRHVSIGAGAESASMLDLNWNFTIGVGADIAAKDVIFNAMRPTGNGEGGRFRFFTPTESLVSSSTLAVMAERLTIETTNDLGVKLMLPFDYVGSGLARGALVQAGSLSTGKRLLQGAENVAGNIGLWAETSASGTGDSAGLFGKGFGGATNIGVIGDATLGQKVEATGVSIGVTGLASNALGVAIGVYGKLGTNAQAMASGAIVADNGPTANAIFLGMSNGVSKFAVNSTGSITNAGGLSVGGFADPGVGNATIPGVGTIGTVTSALINAPATMVIDPVNDLHILTRYMGIRTTSPDAVLDVWDAGTDRPSALNVQIDDVNVFPLTFYNSSLPAAHGGSPSTGVRFRLSNAGELTIRGAVTNGSMIFNTFATNRWLVSGVDGQFSPAADNFYDIGRNDLRVKTNWNVTVDTTNLLVRSLTATRVPFASTAGLLVDDNGLTYDNTFQRLNVGGTAVTTQAADVLQLTKNGISDDVNHATSLYALATTVVGPVVAATIAITANRTYMIEARVTARRTGGAAGTADDGAVYIRRCMVTTKAGTITVNAVQDELTQEDQAAWDCTLVAAGGGVDVSVTGAVNNNITWHTTIITSYVGQ